VPRSLLQVPESQEDALARLVHLEREQHVALSRALHEAKAGFSIVGLAHRVSEASGLDPRAVYDVVRLLAMLYRVRDREQVSPEEFLSEVERAAKETGRADLTETSIDWHDVRQRVAELLSHTQSLGVTAKALDVLTEHERVFCDARVLTDIRPVFAPDVNQAPDALLLVHELRLSFHHGDEVEAIFIAMDSTDLRALRDVLERASKKEASLEALAGKTDVPVLKATSHEA